MPIPYPKEFRADVVAVARRGEQSRAQVAHAFGISESCLARWLRIADRDDGLEPRSTAGVSAAVDEAEVRELRRRNKQLEQEKRDPAPGHCLLRPGHPPKMMFPLVLDLAADPIHKIPVAVTCRVLGFSKQAFYAWKKQPVTQRDWDDAHLINAAVDIHHDDPEFGYRFIADELADAGISSGRNRVNRLCSQQRLWSVHARKRGLSRQPGPPVHDDLVERRFTATAPDRLWLTDMPPQAGGAPSEHPTAEGKVYLCAVKDVWSNRIVGYSIADRMTAQLAVDALDNACQLRRPAGMTVVHSDRGSQFRSHAFVRALHRHGLAGSMGRVGACADNAAMESFFSLVQKNVLNRRRWATREDLRLALVVWIEKTYHRRRRQQALGRLTPVEFETLFQAAPAA